jgi:hypothetical protein
MRRALGRRRRVTISALPLPPSPLQAGATTWCDSFRIQKRTIFKA